MDAKRKGEIFQQVDSPSVDIIRRMQSSAGTDNDSYMIRTQHSTRNENTPIERNKRVGMAHSRCLPQLAGLTIKRMLGYRLLLLSLFSTLIIISIHEYVVPNYPLFLKMAALENFSNGTYAFFGSLGGMHSDSVSRAERRAPGCIIFGVSKCGTRAMLEYLKLHPSVVAASTEIDFFIDEDLYFRGHSWYLQQMPYSREDQITVEKSPDYFQNPKCASRIRQLNSRIKLVLLLRDPVERLISQYMQLMDKNPKLPFFESWAIDSNTGLVNTHVPSIRVSAYAEHLDSWFEAFPRDQILIVESKNLRENPFREMKRVEQFLELRPYFEQSDFYFNDTRGFYCLRYRGTWKTKCLGKSKGRQHIPVNRYVKHILQLYYEPFNSRLNEMLGYKFPWS